MIEKSNGASPGVESPAPALQTPETSGSSPELAIVAPTPAIRRMAADVRLRRRVIRKYERDERKALRDMAARGSAVMEERGDSHGKVHSKLVPNPSIRIARESRAAINRLLDEIEEIQKAMTVALAVPKELTGLAALAGRAGALRK